MAKRILVPLDETVQAESMVEAVAALSRGTGAFVRLLHVAPTPEAVFDEDGRVLAYSKQHSGALALLLVRPARVEVHAHHRRLCRRQSGEHSESRSEIGVRQRGRHAVRSRPAR